METKDITDVNVSLDMDKLKEEHKDMVLSQHLTDVQTGFSEGSIKITNELMNQAIFACKTRLESTAKETAERIEKINDNLESYYSEPKDNKADSEDPIHIPETFNSVHDWHDDLIAIFKDFAKMIEITGKDNSYKQKIIRKLPVEDLEDEGERGMLRSLNRQIPDEEMPTINEIDKYYFNKDQVIKSTLEQCIIDSGISEKISEYLLMGIISGNFIYRDNWLPNSSQELVMTKDGKFNIEIDQREMYKFGLIDPRLLIYPKVGNWRAEKIETTVSDILNIILDEKDKPRKNSTYDYRMIKLIIDYIKDNDIKAFNDRREQILVDDELTQEDEEALAQQWENNGSITIYELHNIPIRYNGKVFNSIVTCVNLDECNTNTDEQEKSFTLVPIRIQKTPWIINGHPYDIRAFLPKIFEDTGRGLPAVVRPMQKLSNNMITFVHDLQEMSLYGMMNVDTDKVKDIKKFKRMKPKQINEFKNLKGTRIQDAYDWMKADPSALSSANDLIRFFIDYLKRTTRKGPNSEKITPNPSATEVAKMAEEGDKSVNTTIYNINDALKEMVRKIYIYNMMNSQEPFKVKVPGYRFRENSDGTSSKIEVEKEITITQQDLFVNGIDFNITAAEEYFKRATERQQILQAVNLFASIGVLRDPQTGQEHIYTDENGQQLKISELAIMEKVLKLFDMEDCIKKVEPEEQAETTMPFGPEGEQMPDMSSLMPGVPQLSASPEERDINASVLNQATTGGV